MSSRAYLLVSVADDIDPRKFLKVLRELEDMPGIEFIDPVAGICDIIIMIDTPLSIDSLTSKLRSKPLIKKIEVLRIVNVFENRNLNRTRI